MAGTELVRACEQCKKKITGQGKQFCSSFCYHSYCSGDRSKVWKGGRRLDKNGYVMIFKPKHPFTNSSGYVREHRLVIEKKLKRFLKQTEIVHHKNGKKDDNQISNLVLFKNNSDHIKEEMKMMKLKKGYLNTKCPNCKIELHRKPSYIKKFKTTACSKKCMAEYYKISLKGKNNPNYKDGSYVKN